jgi:DNA ligase-1
MEFAAFAARADEIEAEPADLETVELVRELLVAADADLAIVARYVQGRVFPAWSSRTLDVGPSLCYEAMARAAGPNVTAADVEQRLADEGEIGAVAETYDFGSQRGLGSFGEGGTASLTVAELDEELRALAAAAGAGSQDRKLDRLFGLFNRTDPVEARYLARLVLSEMRIGVGEGTVRDAIAAAFDVPVHAVERALQVTNDYGRVAVIAREVGMDGLESVELELGRPVRAMLAQAGTATDAVESWESVAVEPKFDGARVQIHHDPDGLSSPETFAGDPATVGSPETTGSGSQSASADRTTAIFSRNMEDVTEALPEIVEFVESAVTSPAILDGEVVAVDDDGTPLPFQEVLRRFRRKHDVDRAREAVTVELHAFDCLHADADDLLEVPLTERHDRLASVLPDPDAVATLRETADAEEIAAIEEQALEAGHEGIMLKNPQSTYSPGKRGQNWLKRKPDVETLDLVVTGAEWGEGRRANHFGTFELSARVDGDGVETAGEEQPASDHLTDGESVGEYVTLGKVATGITDEQLADLTERLEPHVRRENGQTVEFEPRVVFEVGYEEIQQSPTYSSGYALRFPRFLGVREDKTPDSADSLARVERLAASQ